MRNFVLIIFVVTFSNTFSQEIDTDTHRVSIKDTASSPMSKARDTIYLQNFFLRKSAEDYLANSQSKQANEGAIFAFNNPKDGESSYSINASAIYAVNVENSDEARTQAFSSYFQYDRNNLIDKEQDNMKTGIMYTDNFLYNSKNDLEFRFKPELSLSGSFRKDYENNFDAVQINAVLTPLLYHYFSKYSFYDPSPGLPYSEIPLFGGFFNYSMNVGFEYDYRFNGENSKFDGNLLRTFSQFKANLEFFELLSFSMDWQYRYNLWNTTGFSDSSFSFFTGKIEFITKFAKLPTFAPSIGLVYVNGENPSVGFAKQSYYALHLSLRIN
ncbi:hypothetical protein POV27_03050 [Aureisphaera galaxeae]|uniref:hypothetical protein n=1 Tax=Aureisphaera galaxeae TaxID=1538023 RepID=UPI002350FB7E|nr:hypothetical protein [Aureisphaera galaxeae]MDC8003011.1 hypothetical protein [Aureisphaera galaxeae]